MLKKKFSQGNKIYMGENIDGTIIYYTDNHFRPKFNELNPISLMLLFSLDDEKSLDDLITIHANWEKSLGLCLNTNIPLLVGIRYSDTARINFRYRSKMQKVMHLWNCNRFMVITIGDGNSVHSSFRYLSNNYISQLNRGCAVSSHSTQPDQAITNSIRNKFFSAVGIQ